MGYGVPTVKQIMMVWYELLIVLVLRWEFNSILIQYIYGHGVR